MGTKMTPEEIKQVESICDKYDVSVESCIDYLKVNCKRRYEMLQCFKLMSSFE